MRGEWRHDQTLRTNSCKQSKNKLTARLIGRLGYEDRVLVLSLPVDVVDVVGPVVRVVYPLPPEGQLVLLAVLGSLLLHPGESRVQPVRGSCNNKYQYPAS